MMTPPCQPTVCEPSDAQYGIFYWIYLNDNGKRDVITEDIAKSCSKIHHTAQRVDDPTGLKVGVGFGKEFLEKIQHKLLRKEDDDEGLPSQKLMYRIKKECTENTENTGGDIFVHAKGNSVGTLYELQHLFLNSLPQNCIDTVKTNITRGFTYQHHRDVSGYMIGTSNPITTEERRIAAVTQTGGSYAITQKWNHKMNVVKVERPLEDDTVDQQDKWIGCKRETGKLLENEAMNAHVQLMKQVKQKIVRQSLPYTEENIAQRQHAASPSGLFFLAYAKDTTTFDEMLKDLVVGKDKIFEMSHLESGTYWYFPGMTELDNLNSDENDGQYENIPAGIEGIQILPSQQTVYEPDDHLEYGLFYWIYLNDYTTEITLKKIIASCSRIHHTAQRVNDPTGLKVGVGFGKEFLNTVHEKFGGFSQHENLNYKKRDTTKQRKDKLYSLESTGGDIFVHAKGKSFGTLYEFQHLFYNTLPPTCVDADKTNVTRGFTFQHHRDISGYMIGSENPRTADERRIAAVVAETGGSYVITQKWEHYMEEVKVERPSNAVVNRQNEWIGCKRETGTRCGTTGHVALMKAGQERKQPFVRQSLPYTEENGPTGLFFLAYAKETSLFDRMLTKMTEEKGDMLFLMSKNVSGAYWYFPGMSELDTLYDKSQ